MKKSLLLVIPTFLALTACNFFQKKDSEKPGSGAEHAPKAWKDPFDLG